MLEPATFSLDAALADRVRALVAEELTRLLPQPDEQEDGFLSVREAALFLGLTEDAVRSKVKRRELPAYKRGGRIFLSRAELRAWVTGRRA